jgi:hypothetical protein
VFDSTSVCATEVTFAGRRRKLKHRNVFESQNRIERKRRVMYDIKWTSTYYVGRTHTHTHNLVVSVRKYGFQYCISLVNARQVLS